MGCVVRDLFAPRFPAAKGFRMSTRKKVENVENPITCQG